ncbi:UDP-N-acetylmuramate dehydrogenase [Methylomarinovum caldicuralii]|uniref:UDP-N-acetylenolpyruvoylglucosamine reductase n=1 Tax=Methylomarinovum caldicuralii TaxID=438856 RepID=A0AAU9CGM6_9GAMM|nr:UDP-N-acetylmuramate dehydrogenase [Methylomarinovum caldicuralii]BCX80716.1 UDP-N-acetylmuramate dehydrogenase [Methylomarinovum caldicuralii]
MNAVARAALSELRGTLEYRVPLASFTTWRVGGPAERLFKPADRDDLIRFLRRLPPDEPLTWLGLGSNVLVRDGGVPGTVIIAAKRLGDMRLEADGRVYVEAGVPCAHVARFCSLHGLGGTEFLAGIPGTFGGALAMNAGAFGGETWVWVDEVETLDRRGRVQRRSPREYRVGYRRVEGPPGEWFLGAWLKLQRGDIGTGQRRIRELLARRNRTQPTRWPNCGSVFKNPPGEHAARLIEACGLKGRQIGGARISQQHANFIINTGTATAADIENLIELARAEVEARFGIVLELEVRIIGVAP